MHGLRDEVAKLQDGHEELRDEIHTEDLSRAELKIRVEQLVERIVDGHKVPLEFALKQYADEMPSPELERKVQALSAKLEHIGPVNPEAITERGARAAFRVSEDAARRHREVQDTAAKDSKASRHRDRREVQRDAGRGQLEFQGHIFYPVPQRERGAGADRP